MNERWYSLSIADIEKILNTNTSSGLDPREAERRRRRGEGGSVYSSVHGSVLQHITKIATDITVILFVVAALISAFLDDGKRAGVALLLSLVAFAVSAVGYLLSKRRFEAGAELSYPRTKVIRGGRVYVVDHDLVVNGDIILLDKGDIVPCDCRLVSSAGMRAVEFLGKISGKEKRGLNEKDAGFICRPENKPNVSEQKNMLVASAVIVSGSGRAIAVRTGRKTFLSLLSGELDIVPERKKEIRLLDLLSKVLGKVNLALIIGAVPLVIIAMITGKSELGLFDVLLSILALAVSLGSEIIIALTYIFPVAAMKKCEMRDKGTQIKFPHAVQELNYIDSVLVVGNDALCDSNKSVESVFASNNFYDGKSSSGEGNQVLNCFMDLAVLGTSHYLDSGLGSIFAGSDNEILCAAAIAKFAENCGISRSVLEERYKRVEFSPAGVSGYDTTLISDGEEYRVICTSDNASLLALCDYIRTPEGAIALDEDKKSDIIRACSQLSKKSKSVTLVASRISPIARLERLGLIQNQLILEGYIVYSDPYSETLAERIEEMREADITFYYAAEECAESVINAFNMGAVKSKHEIAYASAFRRNGKNISSEFGQYKAYLGFGERELEELVKLIRGEDGTLAVIASETDHLSLLNRANIAVATSDTYEKRTALDTIRESSEIMRKNADILIPFARKKSGGFEAFCSAVIEAKSACVGLGRFLRYLAFSASMKLVLTLIPIFAGKIILGADQIMFLFTLLDIPAMICLALGAHTNHFGDRIEDVETLVSLPFKKLMKYLVSGASLGSVMLMLSAVFGSTGTVSGEHLSTFAFVSAALSQIFALFIIARQGEGRLKNIFISVMFLFVFSFIALAIFFPAIGAYIGISYPGWQVCSASVLISVIGYVILLVTDRYI